MAKKFFYNRVYNTRRTIINVVIIGVCIIGIVVCFILTSNFQGENKKAPEGELSIKKEATVEVNEEFTNDIFFSKIENVDLSKIKIDYAEDYDIAKVGKYDVKITVNGKTYESSISVVDTTKPELALKEITIKEGESYTADSFVDSCSDNSQEKCIINFYTEGVDEEGNAVAYDKYTKAGTYAIKVDAKDATGNQAIGETKLVITGNTTTTTPKPPVEEKPEEKPQEVTCKYGNGDYDSDAYLVAINITTNNCAVSLDLYKNATTSKDINQLMETETTRIKKDVEALNLTGTLALNRKISAVVNKTGDGIVGYELKMVVTITNNGKSETVTEYKVDKDGKRVFIENPHNLAE